MYRRGAARIVGRTITSVRSPDDWYLKGIDSEALDAVLVGASITALDRVGKLLLVETTRGTVGLRFGMTGRLVIDDTPIIEALEYSSKRLDPAWVRFELGFGSGGLLQMNDPRRLGGVSLNPDRAVLGIDAWQINRDQLVDLTQGTTRAIKALLLDQSKIAGLGNLLVDELLWRVGLDARRSAKSIRVDDVAEVADSLGPMLDELYGRGGSHMGDHVPHRVEGALCPLDAAAMTHATVGGRSTWACSLHQR